MILGQDKLLNLIDNIKLDTMPRSLILEGLEGSGKHLICDYIAKHLNITLLDITDNLDADSITNYYLRSEPYIYMIDSSKLSIKNQNAILKFLEEPLKNSYIIILTTNRYKLLETIINRTQIWKLENYSKDTLKQFSDNMLILNIAQTPGEIKKLEIFDLNKELDFANKIIDKINIAAFPNALTLTSHIGFNNEQDKIELSLFLKIMRYILKERITAHADLYPIYKLTLDTIIKLDLANVDKKYLFDKYISDLWYITHKDRL